MENLVVEVLTVEPLTSMKPLPSSIVAVNVPLYAVSIVPETLKLVITPSVLLTETIAPVPVAPPTGIRVTLARPLYPLPPLLNALSNADLIKDVEEALENTT